MAKKTANSPAKAKKVVQNPAKKTTKRKSHVTRPTTAEKLKLSKRRESVLTLSEKGLSLREISKQLLADGYKEASPPTVFRDLEIELAESASRRIANADLLAELEIRKIDKWENDLNTLKKQLDDGKFCSDNFVKDILDIITAFHKNQNQRDKFQQISKREKAKTSAREALAKLMGVSPDQLPKANENK